MAQMVKIGTVHEFPLGIGKMVEAEGRYVAVFNVAGKLFAIDDTCPHQGAPLSEGPLVGHVVACPWHAAEFDVTTGKLLCPPGTCDVASYRVVVHGEEVSIEVP
ncbi:MAG: non-heme iron oxygenase ferredoxin subunit [Planctomycetales bacterium]|nr:non-heme iron oxygenase ferredoxin subunit [Planctomycetales bacterium]